MYMKYFLVDIFRTIMFIVCLPDTSMFFWCVSLPKIKAHINGKDKYLRHKKKEFKPKDIDATSILKIIAKDFGAYTSNTAWYIRLLPTIALLILFLV